MRTVEREQLLAEMRAAVDELALEAIVNAPGPFSYRDIAEYVRDGLRELGYDQRDIWTAGTWEWSRQQIREWVDTGAVVEIRAYKPPSKPKLFLLVRGV